MLLSRAPTQFRVAGLPEGAQYATRSGFFGSLLIELSIEPKISPVSIDHEQLQSLNGAVHCTIPIWMLGCLRLHGCRLQNALVNRYQC